MSTEVLAGTLIALLSIVVTYIGIHYSRKASDKAADNTANAQLTTGYADFVKALQEDRIELRQKLEAAEQARDQRVMGAVNLVDAKADREEVVAVEERLKRAWDRIDADETRRKRAEKNFEDRLEKAEKDFEDCKKEMGEKIRALEAKLRPGNGAPA